MIMCFTASLYLLCAKQLGRLGFVFLTEIEMETATFFCTSHVHSE